MGLRLNGKDSVYREIKKAEEHVHTWECWRGKLGVQTGTDWADDTLSTYQAISGADAYGADADDEALVLGTDDTPCRTGMTKFDIHRLLVVGVSHGSPYKLRIIQGSGTMAQAITAKTYTEVTVQFDVANPQLSAGVPVEVKMKRGNVGVDKVWIQAWNATDNATIDFLAGLHEYEE